MGKLNQKGFSAIEGLLILVIVAIIGGVGLYIYHANQKTNSTLNTASQENSATAPNVSKNATKTVSTGLYSGWSQYCSSHEKACFKYPDSWKSEPNCGGPCTDFDAVNVTSPKGTVVSFTSAEAGVGGDCDPSSTPHVLYGKVEAMPKISGIYFVESTRADIDGTEVGLKDSSDGQTPKVGDTGACLDYLMFKAKNTPDAKVWFHGHVDDAAKTNDLTTAELIIKSFHYQ
jgi:hypothetical protein